jgi:hypothetical protein
MFPESACAGSDRVLTFLLGKRHRVPFDNPLSKQHHDSLRLELFFPGFREIAHAFSVRRVSVGL